MYGATSGTSGMSWQADLPAQDSLLAIRPLIVGTDGAPEPLVHRSSANPPPMPVLLGWHGAEPTAAATSQLPGLAVQLCTAPSPLLGDQHRTHQQLLSEAFEKYVAQSSAARYVYGGRQAPAGPAPAPPPACPPPTPVAFWGAQQTPAQIRAKLAPAVLGAAGQQSTLVRPQPIRPAAPQLTGRGLAPFEYPADALFNRGSDTGRAPGTRSHSRAAAADETATPASRAGAHERQAAGSNAHAARMLCSQPALDSCSGSEVLQQGAGPQKGETTKETSPATEACDHQSSGGKVPGAGVAHNDPRSCSRESSLVDALADDPRSAQACDAGGHAAQPTTVSPGNSREEALQEDDSAGCTVAQAQPPQSPNSYRDAAEAAQMEHAAAEADLDRAGVQDSEGALAELPASGRECSEPHGNVAVASEASMESDGGVLVPVELREDDITVDRGKILRDIALATTIGTPLARSTPACTEVPPLAAGRSKRVPGGDPLANTHVRRLCDMLRGNSRDFQAEGRVLRLKQYVSADIKPPHIDAILDALAVNTRVEVLYIQNFEWGMLDPQLEHLARVLRNKRVWALNVGENFQITLPAWQQFTDALPTTAVAYLYVSEHHLGGTNIKIAMRDAIRVNRKAGPQRDPEVISKVGNMWFNPKMPGQAPRRPLKPVNGSSKAAAAAPGAKRARDSGEQDAAAPKRPRMSAAELAQHRRLQKQAQALERAALPDWLPEQVVKALRCATSNETQEKPPAPARSPSGQAAMKQRLRIPLAQALQTSSNRHQADPLTGEEGKQASFTWLVQRWRGMAAPDNIWGPSIMAAAAAQHQAAAAAAAEAAAAAAASRAKAVSSKSHPASSGTTIREELAAAGNMCIDCGTQQSPAWRRFEGAILCNKCWCRAKAAKMKGGRHACAAASLMRRSERTGKAHADSPAAAPATATDVRYVTRASVVRPDGQEAVQGTCSGAENGARASADKRAAVPAENAAEEPSTEARALREDPGATPAAEPALEQSARASAAETEAASAEAAAVGVSPEASAHIEDRAATPPAEPAAEEQSVPASAAETGGAAAEIANSIEASLPEESTAATPGAEPAMEEQSVLARAAETAAVQTSTQASVPEESAAAIPAPESALQETMHSDADEGAATVPTEPPVVQRITRASKSRAESQAAALESAFQRTTRSGIKRVDVPSQPHRWPPTAAKKATAAATPAAEPALQRSTRSGTAKAAAVPAPVSAMRPRTRAGNAQVESAAPTPPSESSLQRRLRSGIRKVYFLAEESGQPSSAAGEASAAAAPAVESALQNSKHADDATHPPVARDTRARRPPQTERVVVESAAESAPQHSMRTSSAPKAGAAIAPGAASSQQPCRPARTASINDMAPIAALGTAAVPSGPAKMLVERARRIHRHANIASLAAASSSAVAPSPAPSLAAEPPLPMRAVKLAAARVWQEDSAPVPAQEPAPPRVERARRIHRHPSAAGIAGARSTVAASSLAAGPPLPERAAKLAAARTWQGMTPAGVMPHKRKATMRLAPPPPRATALAVEQARRIHRRAPSSAGPPASASRAERRPAAKRRLPPQAPAAAAQVAEAAQAPEATMQEAEAAAPREKRQRRITLRMQEAMEDPGPHMGLRAVADTGACDAAPADGEQPPEGQHEEVQGPGSDVTGALKQREEESTAAAAESAAEADAAPAGQLDGQLGTASKAAAAAIVGRRRPCIAERPPQTGTRLKNWMHATGGKCRQCGTGATPMWRRVDDLVLCNACGLRRKR